ncbi:hypothetical protein LCGC14_0244410 [marine sediment metagenome]|uniref:Uncharacterized protein n=1 Tax=marine sediment metagenome TaxID=412755 RepID=A0A0F9UB36_9ZZZZ
MLASDKYDNYALHLRNQRRRYDNGLPSSHKPEDIVYWERNPEDLAWFLSDTDVGLVTSALRGAGEVFDWMDSHGGKAPTQGSIDQVEKVLGTKLSYWRHNKKNNRGGWTTTYGSELLTLAKKRGYPDVFNTTDLTREALEWAKELFGWMDSHDEKTPRMSSKDPVEKALGSKLSDMRRKKKNNRGGWKLYGPKLLKLAKKRGYQDVFDTIDLNSEALKGAGEIFDWMDSHGGKAPSQMSTDPVEKVLGTKLSNMKRRKKNNKDGWTTYGAKLLKLAKQRGYPRVFNTRGSR